MRKYQTINGDKELVDRLRQLRPDIKITGWIRMMLQREIEKAERELERERAAA